MAGSITTAAPLSLPAACNCFRRISATCTSRRASMDMRTSRLRSSTLRTSGLFGS